MLGRIIEWSVRNVFLIAVMTLAVIAGGVYALLRTPLDAQPDLSDVQVIVFTEYPGQAPQVVEDQVTYPLTSALLSVPKSKVVRGFSFFGASFVYVIFEDGTDLYWARSRVLEYLNFASKNLPAGVTPSLGPDATGVGWVYQYALQGKQRSLDELRAVQDWYVRYQLAKAPGVAEIASVGGFVRQYSVTVDPARLREYGIPLARVAQVVRESNRDVGGRVVEMAETEYMVRGRGYLRGVEDIENLVLKAEGGAPVRVGDVAHVELVPDERRGLAETVPLRRARQQAQQRRQPRWRWQKAKPRVAGSGAVGVAVHVGKHRGNEGAAALIQVSRNVLLAAGVGDHRVDQPQRGGWRHAQAHGECARTRAHLPFA